MKKRREARVKQSLLVDISRRGLDQMGVTVNISRRGMCIATTQVVRKRSRLHILLAAGDDIYSVTGLVVWKRDRDDARKGEAPVGLGLEIEKADPGYGRMISSMQQGSTFGVRRSKLNTRSNTAGSARRTGTGKKKHEDHRQPS
jgi:hypothetical protein